MASSADLLQKNFYRDLIYAPLDAAGTPNTDLLVKIVQIIVPNVAAVPADKVSVKEINGGITNALFRVQGGDTAVRVRIFGGEGMIDRDLETATYCAMADSGLAPAYYGRFSNGRVEGWIDGVQPLTLDTMALPDVSAAVARELAKVHEYVLPENLQPFYSEPGMWKQLREWHTQAQQGVPSLKDRWGADVAAAFDAALIDKVGPTWDRSTAEIDQLEAAVPKDCEAGFCHNDALAGNILRNPDTGELFLIDFEYGGANYRGFDIANHWNEWAGGTKPEHNGVCEYDRFPSSEQRTAFCRAYLEQLGRDSNDAAVAVLVAESQRFVLVNHWYWGLWAINQAVLEGISDFNYIRYAESRLGQYYRVKAEYLD